MPINAYRPYFPNKAKVGFFFLLNFLYGTVEGSPRAFSPFQNKEELFLKSGDAFLFLLCFRHPCNTGRFYHSCVRPFLTIPCDMQERQTPLGKTLSGCFSFVHGIFATKGSHLKNEMLTNQQDKYCSLSSSHWQDTQRASQLL